METSNGGSVRFTDNQTQQTNKTNVFEQVCTTAGAFCKKVRAILRAILSTIGFMASQRLYCNACTDNVYLYYLHT